MPNPYHLKANIDRLWRQANSNAPAYRRLNALDKVVRELFAHTERARLNYQLYLATDPFDVARHLLRDLYDRPGPMILAGEDSLPVSFAEEEANEEDADPL
ncbi:MAG: hypothetical protein F4007_07735 [Chloroflexi bacterium]|nr:hypothetical protein [Chloroflexota bacterium]